MPADLVLNTGAYGVVAGLTIGEATGQHGADLIVSRKGDWKFAPVVGVGLPDYIDDEINPALIRQLIRTEAERDGAEFSGLVITEMGEYLPELTYD